MGDDEHSPILHHVLDRRLHKMLRLRVCSTPARECHVCRWQSSSSFCTAAASQRALLLLLLQIN